jgi:hypothetical protein
MRIRRLTTNTTQVMGVSTVFRPTGSPVNQNLTVGVKDCEARFMSDTVSFNFKRRMSRGEVIVNDMTSLHSTVESTGNLRYNLVVEERVNPSSPFVYKSDSTTTSSNWSGRLRVPHTPLADVWGTAGQSTAFAPFQLGNLNSLSSVLLVKAQQAATESDANYLVTMAEMDKTFDMFFNGAKSMSNLMTRLERVKVSDLRELKKFSFKDMKRILKNPSSYKKGLRGISSGLQEAMSMWLGYRYGIMATYYDVESWADAAKHVGTRRRARHIATGTQNYDSGLTHTLLSDGNFAKEFLDTRYTRFTYSSAGVLTTMIASASSSYTFGVERILTAGWELVPFSFVADWFLDAGDRLSALEGNWVRPVVGSWVTHRSTLLLFKNYYEQGHIKISGNLRYNGTDMNDTSLLTDRCMLVQRIANPSVSPIPEFRVNLNFKRVIDGIALVKPIASRLSDLLELY